MRRNGVNEFKGYMAADGELMWINGLPYKWRHHYKSDDNNIITINGRIYSPASEKEVLSLFEKFILKRPFFLPHYMYVPDWTKTFRHLAALILRDKNLLTPCDDPEDEDCPLYLFEGMIEDFPPDITAEYPLREYSAVLMDRYKMDGEPELEGMTVKILPYDSELVIRFEDRSAVLPLKHPFDNLRYSSWVIMSNYMEVTAVEFKVSEEVKKALLRW